VVASRRLARQHEERLWQESALNDEGDDDGEGI
jgi:hypothetical protein